MVIRITSIAIAVIAVRELTISPFTSFDRNEWEIVILWNDDSSEKKKKKKKQHSVLEIYQTTRRISLGEPKYSNTARRMF